MRGRDPARAARGDALDAVLPRAPGADGSVRQPAATGDVAGRAHGCSRIDARDADLHGSNRGTRIPQIATDSDSLTATTPAALAIGVS